MEDPNHQGLWPGKPLEHCERRSKCVLVGEASEASERIHGFFMVHWVGNPSCVHCGFKSESTDDRCFYWILLAGWNRGKWPLFLVAAQPALSSTKWLTMDLAGWQVGCLSRFQGWSRNNSKRQHVAWKGPNIFGQLIQIPKIRMPRAKKHPITNNYNESPSYRMVPPSCVWWCITPSNYNYKIL